MAHVVGLFTTIRNNWKKSIFFTCVAVYGATFANRKYAESQIRKEYCLEAQKYGIVPLRTGEQARRITVFLNPAAHGGKAKSLFEKNAAPLLHLAGLEVTVVKTEYEGQAKQYMDLIDKTDAIIVAGGDGTLSEVVTGLLRKTDKDTVCHLPVGVIPVGVTNTLAKTLVIRPQSDVRWLAECTMSVIRDIRRPVDVIEVKSGEGKKVYAMSALEWGAYRNVENVKKKYWYFGPLKDRLSYVLHTLKQWPPVVSANMTYILPCEGCSKCYTAPPKPVWKWWHLFLSPQRSEPERDYSGMVNESCGRVHELDVTTVQFTSRPSHSKQMNTSAASISLEPASISRTEFIRQGWDRLKNQKNSNRTRNLDVREFSLQPNITQGTEAWYTIDNEQYEAMAIDARLLTDKIQMFCSSKRPDAL